MAKSKRPGLTPRNIRGWIAKYGEHCERAMRDAQREPTERRRELARHRAQDDSKYAFMWARKLDELPARDLDSRPCVMIATFGEECELALKLAARQSESDLCEHYLERARNLSRNAFRVAAELGCTP